MERYLPRRRCVLLTTFFWSHHLTSLRWWDWSNSDPTKVKNELSRETNYKPVHVAYKLEFFLLQWVAIIHQANLADFWFAPTYCCGVLEPASRVSLMQTVSFRTDTVRNTVIFFLPTTQNCQKLHFYVQVCCKIFCSSWQVARIG